MISTWRLLAFLGFLLCTSFRQLIAQPPDIVDQIRSQSVFFETFDNDDWQSRWIHSRDGKYNGRFTTDAAKGWTNKGLQIPENNKFYGLTALLDAPVDPVVASGPSPLPLVVQYEVKYDAGITCGGSYIKLLSADPEFAPKDLVDSTPYSIMFGPDRCGGTSKVHMILRHRNPVNGSVTEHHLASPAAPETDDTTHVYTLRIYPDHRYEVLVDGAVKSSGSLLDVTTLQPPLLPPRELPDPEDKKPEDWVEVAEVPDPEAAKPEDWDDRELVEDEKAVKPRGWLDNEPPLINDPAAKRPQEWDEEEDGLWEPRQIPNPRCKVGCGTWKRPLKQNPAWKGAWKPPLVKNPEYKGPWVQKTIPNPDFYEEEEPVRSGVRPIGAVALELWTIDSGYFFDNLLLTRDPYIADLALKKLWKPRHEAEVKAFEAQLKENEQKEKERRKEEAPRKKSPRKATGWGSQKIRDLANAVLDMFEDGHVLSPLAPYVAPLLDYLHENPDAFILVVALGPLLLLTFAMLLRGRDGRKDKQPSSDAGLGAVAAPGEEQPAEGDTEPVADTAEGPRAEDDEPAPAAADEADKGDEAAAQPYSEQANEIEEEPVSAGRTPHAD